MAVRDALLNILRRAVSRPTPPTLTPLAESSLPDLADPPEPLEIVFAPVPMADEITGGRSLHDGYQRGCGLAHTNMPAAIEADLLYRTAVEASGGWSIMVGTKRMDLFLILTRFLGRLEHHDVIEFGSYRGGNALFMAHILRELHPEAKVYALDTYTGMPATDLTRDAHHAGDFSDTSQADLEARRDALGLSNLIIVCGRFEDSFPAIAASGATFGMAHIDCDIYSAVKYAQEAVWPHMTKGGYVVYDDADAPTCIGATEAVEELIMDRRLHAEQAWPHWVFRAGLA
jgi:predicted O-methyltransferase YrrM